jgi:H+/Cl- antiporter ClcA
MLVEDAKADKKATMLVADVKSIAMDKWSRYYAWRMYQKRSGWLGAGVGLWLMALVLAIAVFVISTAADTSTASVSQVNHVTITSDGTYTITRYSDESMIIRRDGVTNSNNNNQALPYISDFVPPPEYDFIPDLLRWFVFLSFFTGAAFLLLYVARYTADRAYYVEQRVQSWVDCGELPTTDSVIEFTKQIQEGQGL